MVRPHKPRRHIAKSRAADQPGGASWDAQTTDRGSNSRDRTGQPEPDDQEND